MARTKSSRRWLKEHFDDPYVKRAQEEGWRARAVYKLMEIQQRDRILRPGMTVIDLGAAPGSWSEYARREVGSRGRVLALDLLDMEPIADVTFFRGDFREDEVLQRLLVALGGRGADLVMSDMAPNISGMSAVDQPRAVYLCELALDLARQVLSEGGDLLVKAFQGEGFDPLVAEMRRSFGKVVFRKPKASRARSREVYLLARNFKL